MNYIVFDLEATCEDPMIDPDFDKEIIEIGAVKIKNGKIEDTFDVFVKPIKKPILTDFCKNLTHISQEDVDNGLDFKTAITNFEKWATDNGSDIAYYFSWGNFDRTQIVTDCMRHHLPYSFIDGWHRNLKWQYSEIVLKTKKQFGTRKALRKEGFDFDGQQHRGIDDALNISKIFLKYIDKWKI